ncbi:MAG: pilus assembly PilX N-terminal domain-containing protein [Candidatus Levybacteria bacterium]|nr:pilus assembly PilX N-terminal domain-containing protein [Candidatus Levybacteria bacterium]
MVDKIQSSNLQKGQALLIVVLVMVISLTVGLAVVSRSVTNLRTSTEEESSQRAFSAAEAGVEKAIKTGCITPAPTGLPCAPIASSFTENSSSYTTLVTPLNGTQFLLNGGNIVEADEGGDVWLINHNSSGSPDYSLKWNGNLLFYWGKTDACNDAALEIIVISGSQNSPTTKRYAYDACSARKTANNFSSAEGGADIAGKTLLYGVPQLSPIAITDGILIRVIPLYNSTAIGVKGSVALPTQGNKIESVGISKSTNRKITFYQGYPALPSEFFPYALFSPK